MHTNRLIYSAASLCALSNTVVGQNTNSSTNSTLNFGNNSLNNCTVDLTRFSSINSTQLRCNLSSIDEDCKFLQLKNISLILHPEVTPSSCDVSVQPANDDLCIDSMNNQTVFNATHFYLSCCSSLLSAKSQSHSHDDSYDNLYDPPPSEEATNDKKETQKLAGYILAFLTFFCLVRCCFC